MIALATGRRDVSFCAKAPVARSRANWDPGAMGIGRLAEPYVCDVGLAFSFKDPVKESIWFETCRLSHFQGQISTQYFVSSRHHKLTLSP